MTPADVGRALVAAPWWEWRAGMRMVDATGSLAPVRVADKGEGVRITARAHHLYRPSRDALDVPAWPEWVPDLSDDATAGVLVGMLPGSVTIERDPTTCSVVAFTGAGTVAGRGATQAEAAGRALLACRS